MLRIEDAYEAFCFDQAIGFLGTHIENAMEEAEAGKISKEQRDATARRRAAFEEIVYGEVRPTQQTSRFADPAMLFPKN